MLDTCSLLCALGEHPTLHVYRPAYIASGNPKPGWTNKPASEPQILTLTGADFTLNFGGVTALHADFPVVLTAVASSTHSYDSNARIVRLSVTARTASSITVTIPIDTQYLIPG